MAVVPHELAPLPLPVGACTNLDLNFDAVHRVVLEDWWDARGAFDPRRHWGGVRVRMRLLRRFLSAKDTALVDITIYSDRRLLPYRALGASLASTWTITHGGHGGDTELGILKEVRLGFLLRVDDLRCVPRVGRCRGESQLEGRRSIRGRRSRKGSNRGRREVPIHIYICIRDGGSVHIRDSRQAYHAYGPGDVRGV